MDQGIFDVKKINCSDWLSATVQYFLTHKRQEQMHKDSNVFIKSDTRFILDLQLIFLKPLGHLIHFCSRHKKNLSHKNHNLSISVG